MKTAVSLLLARIKPIDPETHALVAAELALSVGDANETEAAAPVPRTPVNPGKLLRTLAAKLRASIAQKAAEQSQAERARCEAQRDELLRRQHAARQELGDIQLQRQQLLQEIGALVAAGKLEAIVGAEGKIQPLLER